MDLNLFNTVKSRFSDSTIAAIGGQLGLDPTTAKAGFVTFVPVFLAAMVKTSRQQSGFDHLQEIIRDGQYDGTMIDRLPAMLTSGKADEISKRGRLLIDKLLGPDADPIVALVSSDLGFKVSTLRSLWSMLAPMIIDTIAGESVVQAGPPEKFRKRLLATQNELVTAMPLEIVDILELPRPPSQDATDEFVPSVNSWGFCFSLIMAFILTAIIVFALVRYVFNPAKVDKPNRLAPQDADESAMPPSAVQPMPGPDSVPQLAAP